jgi:hypothetical protein
MGWVYTLPRVTEGPAAVRTVLSDWVFGGTFNAHTGRPFDVTLNNDSALDDEPNQRAALIPGVSPKLNPNRHRTAKMAEWFNVNAFTYPVQGTFGNMQRNSLTGPSYLTTNMNFGRYFPLSKIREGMRMLVRADAFNVWNTPNLANPSASYSCSTTSIQQPYSNKNFGLSCPAAGGTYSSTYGTISSTYGNNGNTSTNGRKMQFNLTVFF